MSIPRCSITHLISVKIYCEKIVYGCATAHPKITQVLYYGLCAAVAGYLGQSLLGRVAVFSGTHALFSLSRKVIHSSFSSRESQNTSLILEKKPLDENTLPLFFSSGPIHSLSIAECPSTNDTAVRALCNEIEKNQLTCLSLAYIQFSDTQIEMLSKALSRNRSLKECSLIYCIPNDKSLHSIVKALISHPVLCRLSLQSNSVFKSGMLSLANLIRNNKTIETLQLTYQMFQDFGSEYLAMSLKENYHLKSLDLSTNAMTQKAFDSFNQIREKRPSLLITLPNPISFSILD